MKEDLKAEFYTPELLSVAQLAKMHATISEGMAVAPALIYRDPNFENYLEKFLLNSPEDFTVLLIENDEVAGFCRLKKLEGMLFFNNLYITDKAQGKGYGGLLFLESAHKVLNGEDRELFQLDVFQSNERALKWYLKLGLKEISRTYWYEITAKDTNLESETPLVYKKDEQGFTGIFKDGKRIGSLLNNSIVVLPDTEGLEYIESFKGKRVFLKTKLPFEDSRVNFTLADISLRLSQPLQDMLKNLEKDIERKLT